MALPAVTIKVEDGDSQEDEILGFKVARPDAHFCIICRLSFSTCRESQFHVLVAHFGIDTPSIRLVQDSYGWENDGNYTKKANGSLSQSAKHRTKIKREDRDDVLCFKCGFCSVKTSDADSLLQHIELHKARGDAESGHHCQICDAEFSNLDDICSHMAKRHSKINGFQKLVKTENPGDNFGFKCSFCKVLSTDPASYLQHLQDHRNQGDAQMNPFPCQMCDGEFAKLEDICNHMAAKHADSAVDSDPRRALKCSLCGEISDKSLSFWRHFRKSHPKEEEVPTKHLSMECRVVSCCETFMDEEDFQGHRQINHGDNESLEEYLARSLPPPPVKPKPEKVKCTYCWCKFASVASMEKHVKDHHPNGQKIVMQCDYCGKNCSGKAKLKLHIERIHDKKEHVPCQFCGKKYHKNHMDKHVRAMHLEQTNQCNICGKTFGTATTLLWHIRGVHEKLTPFRCNICGKAFRQRGNLSTHMRGVHKGEKVVKCTICGRRFQRDKALKEHMEEEHSTPNLPPPQPPVPAPPPQIHQPHPMPQLVPNMPRKCEHCPLSFDTDDQLQEHRIMQHQHRPTTAFQCPICKNNFVSRSVLHEHIMLVHRQLL